MLDMYIQGLIEPLTCIYLNSPPLAAQKALGTLYILKERKGGGREREKLREKLSITLL